MADEPTTALAQSGPRTLTEQQERFCLEILVDDSGAAAARRAGYGARGARTRAYELLQMPEIQTRIAELRAERAERLQIEADDVLRELWAIAKADPRELIEYHVGACRYCHGETHRYQRTPAERELALAEWDARHAKTPEKPPFDERGGVGYDRKRPPHSECPECSGLGEGFTVVKDQRGISPAAARLLAGVKETKEGIEVKMHDPQAALVTVGKHVGLRTENIDHTSGGKPLAPTQLAVVFVAPKSG